MSKRLFTFLATFSLVAVAFFYWASSNITKSLSPQGCRMSWMYSLWLYREVGWEPTQVYGTNLPVLFIPGNAGSSRQVRSIASSAARQFYDSPEVASPAFASRSVRPLDFFAVEFNEDLSAFHGSTIESQMAYTSAAIKYILSLYPLNTTIIIMGHSMGGVVASYLLPSTDISAIITMSTPHTLPPVRFDSRIDDIYDRNQRILRSDPTPIISLCGGATDAMIPSETCILPDSSPGAFRRTVFTSALEGSWTGVGHREMVWCHQVRWRKGLILDRWLRDGHALVVDGLDPNLESTVPSDFEILTPGARLNLANPETAKTYFFLSLRIFTLFVSQGSVGHISPQNPIPLRVTVSICSKRLGDGPLTSLSGLECSAPGPRTSKLLPQPIPGSVFPTPNEGSDESVGVVLYETHIHHSPGDAQWIKISVDGADNRGWISGSFTHDHDIRKNTGTFGLVIGSSTIMKLDNDSTHVHVTLPHLTSDALVVYRLTPKINHCSDYLYPPLIAHTSHPSETHYFPIDPTSDRPILLHTHGSAPYVSPPRAGVEFSVYSVGSGGKICVEEIQISIDWPTTLGRWAPRYLTTLVSWSIGIVALVIFSAWNTSHPKVVVPTVRESLVVFGRRYLPKLLPLSLLFSLLPLPPGLYMGYGGGLLFSMIAPLLVLIATGLVYISWGVLLVLMWPLQILNTSVSRRRREDVSVRRGTLLSMCLIFILIALFIPWQVAFLGCWVIQLTDVRNHNMHLLLLMTWLLPLTAPVLAVWVRTLMTAGLTTPFDGDHFFLHVAPFLCLVDFASWTPGPIFERQSFEKRVPVHWGFIYLASVAFFIGPRKAYRIFDAANLVMGFIVVIRVGRRYWGGPPWSHAELK
ncbi:PGAP1-like protein-domain-containing protein [Infundibulicybe gibba]|nr:PGAP1-like protein-domain-containing protein [Infundibulicybe gibba]